MSPFILKITAIFLTHCPILVLPWSTLLRTRFPDCGVQCERGAHVVVGLVLLPTRGPRGRLGEQLAGEAVVLEDKVLAPAPDVALEEDLVAGVLE